MTGTYASFKGKLKVGDRVRDHLGYVGNIRVVNETGFSFYTDDGSTYCRRLWNDKYAKEEQLMELLSPSPRGDETDADFNSMLVGFMDGYAEDLKKLNAKLDEALKRTGGEPVQPASPRVVTLETLEPGDEVERTIRGIEDRFVCIDVSRNGLVVFTKDKDRKVKAFSIKDLTDWGYKPVQPASPPVPAEKEKEWWKEWMSERGLSLRGWVGEDRTENLREIIAEAKRMGAEERTEMIRAGLMECDACRAKSGSPELCGGCRHNRAVLHVFNEPVTNGEK